MSSAHDKAEEAKDKAKDTGKAKPAEAGLRQLNRQELEVLRRQLQARFHSK